MKNPLTTTGGIVLIIGVVIAIILRLAGVIEAGTVEIIGAFVAVGTAFGLLAAQDPPKKRSDRTGGRALPILAAAASAGLAVQGVGCSADDSARAYLIASATHTQAVTTAADLFERGAIDREDAVRFRSEAERSRAVLDAWHDALIEGRAFDTALVLELIDELVVWTLQRKAEDESRNDRGGARTGEGRNAPDRTDRPRGEWRTAGDARGTGAGPGGPRRGARAA